MKRVGGLLLLGIFTLAIIVPARASAKTPAYNNQLEVTGVVLPAQHVVVNEQGTITEILSNTEKDVLPSVYTNRISKETKRTMTSEIYEQYRRIVPVGKSRVGVLYKRTPGAYSFTPLEALRGNRHPSYALPLSSD